MKSIALFCLLVLGLSGHLKAAPATEGSPALAEVQGVVSSMDTPAKNVVILDAAGKAWPIKLTPDTRILNSSNASLPASALEGRPAVRVYYDTRDNKARQIDLIPRSEAKQD